MVDTKRCPGCGGHFPRDPIFMRVERRLPNGRMHFGRCLECDRRRVRERYHARDQSEEERARQRAKNAERNRRYRRAHPERYRVATKKWRDKKYLEPEYRALRNGDQRINYRLRRERVEGVLGAFKECPADYDPWRPPSCHDVVDAAPLLAFIRRMFPGWTAGEIAAITGRAVSERRLRSVMKAGQQTVELSTADKFFTHGLGRPDLLNAIYPVNP